MPRFISWNVNGLRACMEKGFLDFFNSADADVFCIQETKLQEGQIQFNPEGYHQYWNYAQKKGYSGTAVFSRIKPISVAYGINIDEHDQEGRVITLEFEEYYLVNVYTPNAKRELERLDYRMKWEDDFRNYLKHLDAKKPVIVCGDLNVAHKEIDLKNPSSNRRNAGFTDEERGKFTELLNAGFIDTYRYFYPEKTGAYTWWSYMFNARAKNAGWRIDYFCVSERLKDKLLDAIIHSDILGSDHCPVELVLK
ncbi:exodeoxyribonuclease III [Clostridium thermosuccinogenes]|jgi:exodeoxyribonuclease-3|uniref:Exodeoxyribonuclease III n=1 Tax=Clostridium thermosuccinogenes TaxID=84032 RepID=A0A2K2FA53_9CLOT|nr:exodeoxyribonuclease III [Pseudoclostridium thermosuccinogenes]AUS96377.1 exodeoxyribonuclease III [Pseudoclostridium thermosuccinogenes]PNT95673.1 exodeoxyribonuclease III [Pseudoclostridium thermosuccinogenes]PNT96896.1 exodeoxyribonuclease III [Pseudoclostridium thermosuccinogenes]